jgi:type II secretory pathway pseudopilin PulG
MRRLSSARGMSLVEATIILMVLATLTAVISPSIADYVNDAEGTKAKEDVEVIGTGILRLLKDTGSRCLREAGGTECTKANREDLLISAGNEPLSNTATDVTIVDGEAISSGATSLNWLPDAAAPVAGQRGTIDEHLVLNTPVYAAAGFTGGGGPRSKVGWRGAYLNGPVNGDPWGYMYQANTVFLTVATDATDTAGSPSQVQEGLKQAGWQRNVMVVSPGANGNIETSFGAAGVGVVASGDDVVYVLKGSTR